MKVTLHSYARMPEAIWRRLRGLIPKWRPSPKGGRPALDARRVADGIYYILRTGCQWKAAPREYGSGSALHNYFQKWTRHGVFRKLWRQGPGRVRSPQRHPLDLADARHRAAQSTARRGKKPGKTLPTAANWASNARS